MKTVTLFTVLCSLGSVAFGQVGDLMFPYGSANGDSTLPANDDSYSSAITLTNSFQFFGQSRSSLYVCTNGILSFNSGISSYTPTPFPIASNPVCAPFWGDVDTRYGGNVFYREVTEGTEAGLLALLSDLIESHFGPRRLAPPEFSATWAFVTTWDQVPAYGRSADPERNTFQAALVTDGTYSYVIYNYQDIEWTDGTASSGIPAQVGFDAGDQINFYAVPSSRTSDIVNIDDQTNVGEPVGRWMFRVDLAEVIDGGSDPVCVEHDGAVAPVVSHCPEMNGPTITNQLNNGFEFTCEFTVAVNESRTLAEHGISVEWLFDGELSDAPVTIVPTVPSNGEVSVALTHTDIEGEHHMGKWVSCGLKTYWTNNPTSMSEEMRSNSYWIGVRAYTINEEGEDEDLFFMTVDEADDSPQHVYLASTVPVLRDPGTPAGDGDHRFMIYSPNSLTVYQEELGFNCSYDLLGQDWDTELLESYNDAYPLVVRTLVTPTTEGYMLDSIVFEWEEDDTAMPSYWQGYAPPSITVYRYNNLDRVPETCVASGDPRMTTFDGTYYTMNQVGPYTLAKSSSLRGFEVEAIMESCDRAGGSIVSCVCALAMREGEEVYYAYMCRNTPFFTSMKFPNYTHGEPHESNFIQDVDSSGHSYSVTTPAGANMRFYVYDWGFNVYLTILGRDFDKMEGLCGTFNRDPSDDLMYMDNGQEIYADPDSAEDVAEFSFAWKEVPETSLFARDYTPPTMPEVEQGNQYCTCNHPVANSSRCEVPEPDVTPGQGGGSFIIPINVFGTPNQVGSPFGGGHTSSLVGGSSSPGAFPLGRRRKRSVDLDFDWGEDEPVYNQNIFPTPSNITAAQARAYCEETLTGGCGDTTLDNATLEGIITNCMDDVRDLDSMDSVSDVYIGQTQFTCIMSIVQIVNNDTNENSTIAEVVAAVDEYLGPVVTSMCTADCSGHGVCADATCTCNEGWVGAICDIDEASLPDVESFTFGDVCDSESEACTTVYVRTSDIFNVDTLGCKVQYDGQDYIMAAVMRSFSEMECDLPDVLIDTTNQIDLVISLTRDGENYGDSAPYRIYSSSCLDCSTASDDCTILDNTCSISGTCYNEGDQNDAAICFTCNVTNTQEQFTEEADCDNEVDGQGVWQAWNDWDDCSVTCDYGWETRDRDCFVADTCLDGYASESQLCLDYRCVEVEDEMTNSVLVTIEGSSNYLIGLVSGFPQKQKIKGPPIKNLRKQLLDSDESMRSVVATKLNNYCVDNPNDCCDLVGASPSSPSMSVFTADEVRIAAGTMYQDSVADTITMRFVAEIDTAVLTAACAGSRRRRRSTDTVYVYSDIMEDALEESIDAFAALNINIVHVGEIIVTSEEGGDSDEGSGGSGSIAASTIGIAIGCVLAAIVLVVLIGIVIHKKTKSSTPVQPMTGQSNPAMVTQDEMALQYKHKMINVAPPPAYETDPDGLAGGMRQAPPSYNTMGHKIFG